MANYKHTRVILVCASFLLLNACSKTISASAVPEEGLTVSEIYNQSIKETASSWTAPRYRVKTTHLSNAPSVATALNKEDALFKPLENPAIPIYVYPHVALIGDEQLLKPGFTTQFFLYKQNQFALASERY